MSASPRWRRVAVAVATMVSMAVTASLGLWQLGRADQKRARQAQLEDRQGQPPVAWSELRAWAAQGTLPAEVGRAVVLRGRWLHEATVFLDNRQMHGRPGFFVVTPLLDDGGGAVLVQRGWAPRDFQDRTALPTLPTVAGEVTVQGRLAPAPARVYAFDGEEQGPIRQNIDLSRMAQAHGLRLVPASVLQAEPTDAAPADGLLRDWPALDSGVPKHLGYAFQWFGLCALFGFLYVWYQLLAPRRRRA